jgi:Protein of unknown function (DUF3800)
MFLMFVDESGDCGLVNSPSRFFVLSGLVIHELRWKQYLAEIVDFRRYLRARFTLKLREEIHSGQLISSPGPLARIPKHHRLEIIKLFADKLSRMLELNFISVVVDKQGKTPPYDVFENAWRALIQRFENTITWGNFPGPNNTDERGMLICDDTDNKKLTALLRRMRVYNPVPHQQQFGSGYRNLALQYLIEDPVFRDSRLSYFIQAADIGAFLLYQYNCPSSFMRKKGARNYFRRLGPVLCRHAAPGDPDGVVRL